jgi:hypothetical protein
VSIIHKAKFTSIKGSERNKYIVTVDVLALVDDEGTIVPMKWVSEVVMEPQGSSMDWDIKYVEPAEGESIRYDEIADLHIYSWPDLEPMAVPARIWDEVEEFVDYRARKAYWHARVAHESAYDEAWATL